MWVCGTNTTVSSTNSDLDSHAHQGTVDGTLQEGNDTFVFSFLCIVERCVSML